MVDVRRTVEFHAFFDNLRDERAKAKIATRIMRLASGNMGDAKSVGMGINEMRIDYGPGYRVYFKRHGDAFVVLLCAGDKSTQGRDTKRALLIAEEYDWS